MDTLKIQKHQKLTKTKVKTTASKRDQKLKRFIGNVMDLMLLKLVLITHQRWQCWSIFIVKWWILSGNNLVNNFTWKILLNQSWGIWRLITVMNCVVGALILFLDWVFCLLEMLVVIWILWMVKRAKSWPKESENRCFKTRLELINRSIDSLEVLWILCCLSWQ